MTINTNREYLNAALSRFDVSSDDVDLILLDSPTLSPDGNVDVRGCKTAIYNSLSTILPMANISEAGFSKTWNMDALKIWYSSLCAELGFENRVKPKIRNRGNRW